MLNPNQKEQDSNTRNINNKSIKDNYNFDSKLT